MHSPETQAASTAAMRHSHLARQSRTTRVVQKSFRCDEIGGAETQRS
jgi:hypothetical protein